MPCRRGVGGRRTLAGLRARSGRADLTRIRNSRFHAQLLSVLLPIPDLTQSNFIALVQGELRIFSMRMSFTVSLYLTLSLSAPIDFLRRVLFDEGAQDTKLFAHHNENG